MSNIFFQLFFLFHCETWAVFRTPYRSLKIVFFKSFFNSCLKTFNKNSTPKKKIYIFYVWNFNRCFVYGIEHFNPKCSDLKLCHIFNLAHGLLFAVFKNTLLVFWFPNTVLVSKHYVNIFKDSNINSEYYFLWVFFQFIRVRS